jgi:hypothetical protein
VLGLVSVSFIAVANMEAALGDLRGARAGLVPTSQSITVLHNKYMEIR